MKLSFNFSEINCCWLKMTYLDLSCDWDENMTANFASFNLQEFLKFQNSSFTAQVTLETVRSNHRKGNTGSTLLPSLKNGW